MHVERVVAAAQINVQRFHQRVVDTAAQTQAGQASICQRPGVVAPVARVVHVHYVRIAAAVHRYQTTNTVHRAAGARSDAAKIKGVVPLIAIKIQHAGRPLHVECIRTVVAVHGRRRRRGAADQQCVITAAERDVQHRQTTVSDSSRAHRQARQRRCGQRPRLVSFTAGVVHVQRVAAAAHNNQLALDVVHNAAN